MMYAADKGWFAPAAKDIMIENKERWHGRREEMSDPFDGQHGPLAPYMGASKQIRMCPSFSKYDTSPYANQAFESSCGGYGYNRDGVGSQVYLAGRTLNALQRGMPPDAIDKPSKIVMFCDTAFALPYCEPLYLIEYSFAEPYTFVNGPNDTTGERTTPSIHYRHRGKVNVVWCDGHVTSETPQLPPVAHFSKFNINWLGPADNSLFGGKTDD
jgi:prepilin-type processing-associated H-X9-DG protein